jgi:hypothetical protein
MTIQRWPAAGASLYGLAMVGFETSEVAGSSFEKAVPEIRGEGRDRLMASEFGRSISGVAVPKSLCSLTNARAD